MREQLPDARAERLGAEAVVTRIADTVPNLASIAEVVRQQADRTVQPLATIGIIISIMAWLFPKDSGSAGLTPAQVQQEITHAEQKLNHLTPALDAPARRPGRAPIGNAPRACGSGVKFHRCCGAPGQTGAPGAS